MAKKKTVKVEYIPTVKCKNCIKYEFGIWVDCDDKRLHCETPRVCEIFKLKE
ncbi:hypothetical protein KAR91_65905 [Candidatus Pacearchaeota archaeon]|nr:hypothetical protein [Candidatus Pacearchaeota archaeon]